MWGAIASFPGSSAPKCEVVQAGRAWYFFLREPHQGLKGDRKTIILHRCTQKLRTGKWVKVEVTCYMYLVFRGWISHTPSIECIVGWTMCNTFTFCYTNSGHFSIPSCSYEKRYQVLPGYTCSRSRVGKPGNDERVKHKQNIAFILSSYQHIPSLFPTSQQCMYSEASLQSYISAKV